MPNESKINTIVSRHPLLLILRRGYSDRFGRIFLDPSGRRRKQLDQSVKEFAVAQNACARLFHLLENVKCMVEHICNLTIKS